MILLVMAWLLASIAGAMIFFATFRPWAAALALSYPVLLGGPPVVHHLWLLALGLDESFAVFGGTVSLSRTDPAALSGLQTGWLTAAHPHAFNLTLPEFPEPVSFRITSVVVPGGQRDGVLAQVAGAWTACPGRPGPAGLWHLDAGLPQVAGCQGAASGQTQYFAATAPQPALVTCSADGSFCDMDLLQNGMELTATFSAADLGQWLALRDHLQQVLDRSFAAQPQTP